MYNCWYMSWCNIFSKLKTLHVFSRDEGSTLWRQKGIGDRQWRPMDFTVHGSRFPIFLDSLFHFQISSHFGEPGIQLNTSTTTTTMVPEKNAKQLSSVVWNGRLLDELGSIECIIRRSKRIITVIIIIIIIIIITATSKLSGYGKGPSGHVEFVTPQKVWRPSKLKHGKRGQNSKANRKIPHLKHKSVGGPLTLGPTFGYGSNIPLSCQPHNYEPMQS